LKSRIPEKKVLKEMDTIVQMGAFFNEKKLMIRKFNNKIII